ncbi:hypothetical protein GCM10009793_07770 [Brachybacterium phenoliresistens]
MTRSFDFDLEIGSPYVMGYRGAYEPNRPVDDDGIVITDNKGQRVYHPVDSCWYLFPELHSYEVDGDPARLHAVLATTEYLLAGAEEHQIPSQATDAPESAPTSLWFPYHFAHAPGGLENHVPWYSGMAQGMMLSHLVRLHEVTGEDEWLDDADLVFNSFRHYRDGSQAASSPWFVSFIDRDDARYTAFEEYPSNNPGQLSSVVNGNIYAMWGVYDYLRATGDRYARRLLSRALASLAGSFPYYRAAGSTSLYGLTPWSHLTWKNPASYHRGVITQLRRTAAFSRDPQFLQQADLLALDDPGE